METVNRIHNFILTLVSCIFLYFAYKFHFEGWTSALFVFTGILLLPFVREDLVSNLNLIKLKNIFIYTVLFLSIPLLILSLEHFDTQTFFNDTYRYLQTRFTQDHKSDDYYNDNFYKEDNDDDSNSTGNSFKTMDEDYAFQDGEFLVGKDIKPGVYRSEPSDYCYWERRGLGDDGHWVVLESGIYAPAIVEIKDTDYEFYSEDCIGWKPVEKTYSDKPLTNFSDGMYVVGKHIKPGLYKASDGSSSSCYWERLSGFSGSLDDIIDNRNSVGTVNISPSDKGFLTHGCGTWKLVK